MTISEKLVGVQKEVQWLVDETGSASPSQLVAAAKRKSSPAHDAFEWDNNKAGHEWRLLQARQYLKKVSVTYEEREEKLTHVPVSYSDVEWDESTGREGFYKPQSVVVRDPDLYALALAEAQKYLNAAIKAVEELEQAARRCKKYKAAKKARRVHSAVGDAASHLPS